MKRYFSLVLISVLVLTGFSSFELQAPVNQKQEEKKKEAQMLDSAFHARCFIFDAQTAIPMQGRSVQLTSDYDLTIKGDSVKAWLPFYGRAYHVDYGDTNGGIKFSEKADSITEEYSEKKQMYVYTVKVRTEKDTYQLTLSSGDSGYANLTISSNNRQPISFYGRVRPLEK